MSILDDVDDPVITHIEVLDAPLYITLDGSPASASSYDFKLAAMTPGAERYQFITDPASMKVFSTGGAASYKVGFESLLISRYPIYRPVSRTFGAAPLTSSSPDISVTSGSDDIFQAVLQVQGADPLYVTLDGRTVSPSDYDRKFSANASEAPADAYYLNVAPNKIKIIGGADTDYKLAFIQFADLASGEWTDNPLYSIRGFR